MPTDERSDLYSVGVSLYQMVTGQRMFSATSSFSLMQAQVAEAPRPPIAIVPTLPNALNEIIMMAVAKDPAQRFQSATAFRQALSQVPLSPEDHASSAAAAAAATTAIGGRSAPMPAPTAAAPHRPLTIPGDYGSTVAPAKPNRALLVVAILVLLALLTGGVVYKSRQHAAMVNAPVAPQPVAPAATGSNPVANTTTPAAAGAPNPTTSTPTPAIPTPPVAQETPQGASPAAVAPKTSVARKAASTPDNAAVPAGPSAADIQAEQQAAAEHKKLLDDMETENDQLNSRASSVESSLGALEQQMHNSGLGLRGDMVAARANMQNDLTKAQQALEAGDTDRGRHFLDLAHHEVEKLEAFLGRR
jgi:serine/threonine-protein kinase